VRKNRRGKLTFGLVVLGIALAASLIIFRGPSGAQEIGASLSASGTIQVEEVAIASEFGGLIETIPVSEADAVALGDTLAVLDTRLLDAQIAEMQATLEIAEAGLAQARAGARPGQIAVARAQLAQATAGALAAQQAVTDTLALVQNPQEIDLMIAVTRAEMEAARHEVARAIALKDAVEIGKEQFDAAREQYGNGGPERFPIASGTPEDLARETLPDEVAGALPGDPGDLPDIPDGSYRYGDYEVEVDGGTVSLYRWVNISYPLGAHMLPNAWWQAWVGVNAASARSEGLEARLAQLLAQRADPQAAATHADAAAGAHAQAEAHVALAQAQVSGLEAGARDEQLAALEARVAQARAGLEALQAQRDLLTLSAPMAGSVLHVIARPGEVVAAGATILTLGDLSDLTLTVYVPENQLGEVSVGQPVRIAIDSFPDQVFRGSVRQIADQAEFTPRNVATKEERVHLVFAVEIEVDNRHELLKPGMPADVVFTAGGA
jgi:multidrug resistance efflux pump